MRGVGVRFTVMNSERIAGIGPPSERKSMDQSNSAKERLAVPGR